MISWIIFGSPFANILALFLFWIEMLGTIASICALWLTSPYTKAGREYEKENSIRWKFCWIVKHEYSLAYMEAELNLQQGIPDWENPYFYQAVRNELTYEQFQDCRKRAEEWYELRQKASNWETDQTDGLDVD